VAEGIEALRAELAAFGQLREVLLHEQTALLANDVDAVLQLADKKSQLVERLGELAALRSQAVDRLPGAFATRAPQDPPDTVPASLRDLWKDLLHAAREARNLNETNGQLVTARLQHNHSALATLRAAERGLALYGPDGHNDFQPAHRELGRA